MLCGTIVCGIVDSASCTGVGRSSGIVESSLSDEFVELDDVSGMVAIVETDESEVESSEAK
jgi:hypothetical protein